MEVPLWLVPLIMQGKARFWHDTAFYIIPPGISTVVRWGPKNPDSVFCTFMITFGKPRDYFTGEIVYTDEIYFWHRGKEMIWHYDPLTESIIDHEYPHLVTATIENPIEIEFVNRSSITIIMDVSVWLFEYSKADAAYIEEYIRGITNFFRLFSKIEKIEDFRRLIIDDIRRLIRW